MNFSFFFPCLSHSTPIFLILVTLMIIQNDNLSVMKQQFAITRRYEVLQETEKARQILIRPIFKHVIYQETNQVCLWIENFDRRCVLTQMCSDAGIAVSRIVRVMKNCSFVRDTINVPHYWISQAIGHFSALMCQFFHQHTKYRLNSF